MMILVWFENTSSKSDLVGHKNTYCGFKNTHSDMGS